MLKKPAKYGINTSSNKAFQRVQHFRYIRVLFLLIFICIFGLPLIPYTNLCDTKVRRGTDTCGFRNSFKKVSDFLIHKGQI
jgi:hypothetical protein